MWFFPRGRLQQIFRAWHYLGTHRTTAMGLVEGAGAARAQTLFLASCALGAAGEGEP